MGKKKDVGRIPFTNFAVDYWRPQPGLTLFFLTHVHAGIIYCSPITKALLLRRTHMNERYVRTLEVNTTSVIFLDEAKTVSMNVTPIDANHCPGAVMLLFEGYFGRILHTGDFRFKEEMLLHPALNMGESLDALYLDSTYCSPRSVFPSREIAYLETVKIIRANKEKYIVVGIDSIGKEELLIALAEEFETKILVHPDRFAEIELMRLPPVFTTDPEDSFIEVVMKSRLNYSALEKMNYKRPTIGILPTGWKDKFLEKKWNSFTSDQSKQLHYVCYSLHSSYSELVAFVSHLRPRQIIGTAEGGNVDLLAAYLNPQLAAPVVVPEALRNPSNAIRCSTPVKPLAKKKKPLIRKRTSNQFVPEELPQQEEETLRALKRLKSGAELTVEEMGHLKRLGGAWSSEEKILATSREVENANASERKKELKAERKREKKEKKRREKRKRKEREREQKEKEDNALSEEGHRIEELVEESSEEQFAFSFPTS